MSATRAITQAAWACEAVVEHVVGCRVCWLEGTRYCSEVQPLLRAWWPYSDKGQRSRITERLTPDPPPMSTDFPGHPRGRGDTITEGPAR